MVATLDWFLVVVCVCLLSWVKFVSLKLSFWLSFSLTWRLRPMGGPLQHVAIVWPEDEENVVFLVSVLETGQSFLISVVLWDKHIGWIFSLTFVLRTFVRGKCSISCVCVGNIREFAHFCCLVCVAINTWINYFPETCVRKMGSLLETLQSFLISVVLFVLPQTHWMNSLFEAYEENPCNLCCLLCAAI